MEPVARAGAGTKSKAQRSKPAKEELLTSSHEEAKELCRLAQQIGTLAPWEWMEETDLFGVPDPVTGEIGFVSVLGALGEYRAIAVYRGVEGLPGWLDFYSALELDPEHRDAARLLLEIPHLHVSFSDSDLLEKRDRDLLKGVGLKFTGDRPPFRSSRPGYLPWYITREEARLLIHTLSQAIIIAERLVDDPNISILGGPGKEGKREKGEVGRQSPRFEDDDEDATFLVRVSREQGSELVWEDRVQKTSPRTTRVVPLAIETAVLKKLKRLAQTQLEMEADLFMGPGAVGKRGDRPAALFTL